MIDFGQAVWLALVQGLTEFLPVSSSAHLVLLPILADWPDQALAFDVAVHVGTLGAVVVYLRRDLVGIVAGWLGQWGSGAKTEESRIGWLLIVATMPAVVVGFFLDETVELLLRHPLVIAAATSLDLPLSEHSLAREVDELQVASLLFVSGKVHPSMRLCSLPG